jgi:hypothetical protein
MSSRSAESIAAKFSERFGCAESLLSMSPHSRFLAGAWGGGQSVATTLRRDVMATVSPSFTAFNTDGNESLISRTDAVFMVKQGCFTN